LNDLASYVYSSDVVSSSMTERNNRILSACHSKPLETCAKLQKYAFLTLSGDSIQDPGRNIWGDRKFATVVVSKNDKGQLDWVFHLGFGHRFVFNQESGHQYYCVGFLYGSSARGKLLLAVEISDGQNSGLLGKRRRQEEESVGDSNDANRGIADIRVYSTHQLIQVGIPKVEGNILTAVEGIRNRFFSAEKNLFSKDSELPQTTLFSEAEVF